MIAIRHPSAKSQATDMHTLLSSHGWFRFGVIFLLLGFTAFIAAPYIDAGNWPAHGMWCVAGFVLVLPIFVRIFYADRMMILLDHRVMFTAAFALYFLFGASLLSFGSEWQIAYAMSNYRIDAIDSLRVDAINGIGFGLALIASALAKGRWNGKQADRLAAVARHVPELWVMVILLAVGVFASMNVLLYDFSFTQTNVAGVWRTSSQFVLVAIFLGSAYRGKHSLTLLLVVILLAAAETIAGALLFNKTSMLLPIAAVCFGLMNRFGIRKVLPGSALLLVVIFISVGGAVSYSRSALSLDAPHPLSLRWKVFMEGLEVSHAGGHEADYSSWARFCYVPPQAAAYNMYNAGNGGEEFRLIPWLFVPRLLAPNKPIITDNSVDFSRKIIGSPGANSATGVGIFASGYYSGGWFGFAFAALSCGWLLAQTSAIANAILRRKALLLLPFAMLGVFMAFRIDGSFLADYFGAFIYLLYPLALVSLLFRFRGRGA